MAHRLDIVDGITDDMSIAQGLLRRPRIPSRGTSFMGPCNTSRLPNGSNNATESSEGNGENERRRQIRSSNTWTSSSGDVLSDHDDVEDRGPFIQEYNRLARKHGVRLLAPDDLDTANVEAYNSNTKTGGWFTRNILRKTSSTQSMRRTKHRRSISDLSLRLKAKKDMLKDKDLQELVRLCGMSRLYLPAEYAGGSLAVPTCFRATAQFLVQHAPTARGVFRIPGSHSVVTALYNHYCTLDEDGEVVAGTVRCPTLPEHIKCDVHDVASAFKRFLSGLPGGILGSLPVFYAFVSIQNQLQGDPEVMRTKQSKVRARLIALAVWTLRSQYRRELICAVFGLLSLIGRAAETARREDDRGRPLPTSDLMGYGPLGIVFGPLLVGDILDNYVMRLANPHAGLVLLPASPPKSRKEKQKKSKGSEEGTAFNLHVDKIKVANGVTEMLITHWRDVVRHMKDLKPIKPAGASKYPFLRPSASETFALRVPPDWDHENSTTLPVDRSVSPSPIGRSFWQEDHQISDPPSTQLNDTLVVTKHRIRNRPLASQRLSTSKSMSVLSPTIEEPSIDLIDLNSAELSAVYLDAMKPPTIRSSQTSLRNGSTSPTKPWAIAANHDPTQSWGRNTMPWKPAPQRTNYDSHPPLQDFQCPVPVVLQQPELQQISAQESPSEGNQLSEDPCMGKDSKSPQHSGWFAVSGQGSSNSTPVIDPPFQTGDTDSGARRRKQASSKGDSNKSLPSLSREVKRISSPIIGRAFSNSEPTSFSQNINISFGCNTSDKSVSSMRKNASNIPSRMPDTCKSSPLRIFKLSGSGSRKSPSISENPSSVKCPAKLRKEGRSEVRTVNSNRMSDALDSSINSQKTKTPQKSQSIAGAGPSPRVSVKALAARFNSAESTSPCVPQSTTSPTKTSVDEFRIFSESPKNIIAPYTTNPPSPTRSQKSGKSERSIQSAQSPILTRDQSLTTPSKITAPQRLVRDSVNDIIPLRSVIRSVENPPQSVDGGSELEPAKKNLLRKPTPSKFLKSCGQSPAKTATPPVVKDLRSLDGPSSLALPNSSTLASSTSPPPIPYHVRFAQAKVVSSLEASNSSRLLSSFTETLSSHSRLSPASSPAPTRSNSVLHTQVRALQRKLEAKAEEIRHLKQKISNRGTSDIVTLNEVLRKAKQEAQCWKSRALVAEKQIEVMGKLSSRSQPSVSMTRTDQKDRSGVLDNNEGAMLADKVRISLRGMDGAASLQRGSSGETSSTVLRDLEVIDSDYSNWVEQIGIDMSSNSLLELNPNPDSPKSEGLGDQG